jgi:CelD/BcsL family acetyltransferase involved in cellulose biosynthesis
LARAGWLRFEELWVEGACRASIYGLDARDTYCFYQSGYDPAWGSRSVGLVLLGLSIEQAIARGAKVYDFLHGTETYKLDWATRTRQTVALRVAARSLGTALVLAGEGAELAARRAAHTLLPQTTVGWLRRIRRSNERREGGKHERLDGAGTIPAQGRA